MSPQLNLNSISDQALARRAAQHDPAAIRLITTRNNQRLFRTAWSVLRIILMRKTSFRKHI